MKNVTYIVLIFIVSLSSSVIAQDTTWFDANWQITTKEKGEFYRPAPKKMNTGYWIIDFYKSGQKQMEGFSTSDIPLQEAFDGRVMYFHENGKPYHIANYKNGKLNGSRKVFYDTGELKEEGRYRDGKREGIWKTFLKGGKIESRGKYKNGEKVGIWKTFYKNI